MAEWRRGFVSLGLSRYTPAIIQEDGLGPGIVRWQCLMRAFDEIV